MKNKQLLEKLLNVELTTKLNEDGVDWDVNSDDIWDPPKGTFAKDADIDKTANTLKSKSKDLSQATSRLEYFMKKYGMCNSKTSHYDKSWCDKLNNVKKKLKELFNKE